VPANNLGGKRFLGPVGGPPEPAMTGWRGWPSQR